MNRPPKPEIQKRPRGTGTISPVWDEANGAWRFKARFPDGKGNHLPAGTHASEDDAHAALNALTEERASATLAGGGGLTLRSYGESWFVKRELAKDGANIPSERGYWRFVLAAPFADYPLSAISFADVRDWARSLKHMKKTRSIRRGVNRGRGGTLETIELDETISYRTQVHALTTLRRCLNEAKQDGHIDANPCVDVSVPTEKKKVRTHQVDPDLEDDWTYLTTDEIQLIEDSDELTDLQREALMFAIQTGLREGELFGLRWIDVYLDHPQPHIRVRRGWDGSPKSNQIRSVHLLPRAERALRWIREQARTKCGGAPPRGLVLPAHDGSMHARGYDFGWADVRDYVKKPDGSMRYPDGVRPGLRSKLGIRPGVVFHSLRHTCASHLLMGTWTPERWTLEMVRDHLGHSDVKVTQRYAHLADSVRARAVADARLAEASHGHVHNMSDAKNAPLATSRNDSASPARFELATYGLGSQCPAQDFQQLAALRTSSGHVRALLEQMAGPGPVSRELAIAFALGAIEHAGRLSQLAHDLSLSASAVLGASDAELIDRLRRAIDRWLSAGGAERLPEATASDDREVGS